MKYAFMKGTVSSVYVNGGTFPSIIGLNKKMFFRNPFPVRSGVNGYDPFELNVGDRVEVYFREGESKDDGPPILGRLRVYDREENTLRLDYERPYREEHQESAS